MSPLGAVVLWRQQSPHVPVALGTLDSVRVQSTEAVVVCAKALISAIASGDAALDKVVSVANKLSAWTRLCLHFDGSAVHVIQEKLRVERS